MKSYTLFHICLVFAIGVVAGMVARSLVDPRTVSPGNISYYDTNVFHLPIGFITIIPRKPKNPVRVPILLYHYVEYVKDTRDTIRQQLSITPSVFENQLKTLQEAGYTFLFIDDLADILDGNRRVSNQPVILTFDDGYRDFYTDVFPILKKYNIKATAYIVPGFLDHPNYMSRDQVKELSESGIVEIASHTIHHVNLTKSTGTDLRHEIENSKLQLGVLIGKNVKNFAYPYGGFSNEAESVVKQAGYRTAVSVIPGENQSESNRFYLSRLRPGGRTGRNLTLWLDKGTVLR